MTLTKKIILKVPDIGSCESIQLLKWNFSNNAQFNAGDELCDLISDKATFALEAPQSGKIIEILVTEKSTVQINDPLCTIEI